MKVGSIAWRQVLARVQDQPPVVHSVAAWLHTLSRTLGDRQQSQDTWFLRNLPMLLAIRDTIDDFECGETVRFCTIGCSTGAEIYSVLWMVRKARPDLKILPTGVDISKFAIEKARAGRYSLQDPELRGVSEESLTELFDITGDALKIKEWIAEGVEWKVGDARDDRITAQVGLQDIVLANNFLIHMTVREATACLHKIVKLVRLGGLLVCWGIDLDVRERVAQQLQLQPIPTRIEEIYKAASGARNGWPWHYWGLEPLDKRRKGWGLRYASLFRVPGEFAQR